MKFFSINDSSLVAVCHEEGIIRAIKILAYVIMIVKILVPIILIVTGIINLFKATLSDDDGAVKKSVSLFLTKFIVGALIFFIPTIFSVIMNYANGYDKSKSKFMDCLKCLNSVKACNNLIGKN